MFVRSARFFKFVIWCALFSHSTEEFIFLPNFIWCLLKRTPKLFKLQAPQNLDFPFPTPTLHIPHFSVTQEPVLSLSQSNCQVKSVKWKVSKTSLITRCSELIGPVWDLGTPTVQSSATSSDIWPRLQFWGCHALGHLLCKGWVISPYGLWHQFNGSQSALF